MGEGDDETFGERVGHTAAFSTATTSGGELEAFDSGLGRTPMVPSESVASLLGRFQCLGFHQRQMSLVKCQGCEGFPWLSDERGGMMLRHAYRSLAVAHSEGFRQHLGGQVRMWLAHGKCRQGKQGAVQRYHAGQQV